MSRALTARLSLPLSGRTAQLQTSALCREILPPLRPASTIGARWWAAPSIPRSACAEIWTRENRAITACVPGLKQSGSCEGPLARVPPSKRTGGARAQGDCRTGDRLVHKLQPRARPLTKRMCRKLIYLVSRRDDAAARSPMARHTLQIYHPP